MLIITQKRKIMENLSDTLLTTIIVVMTLMLGNMHLRVRDLEKKLGK